MNDLDLYTYLSNPIKLAGGGDYPQQQTKIVQPEVHVNIPPVEKEGMAKEVIAGVMITILAALILAIIKRSK